MRVLFVAYECAPFAKAGGVADFIGALPKALRARGIDARVLIPRFSSIEATTTRRGEPLGVPMSDSIAWCAIDQAALPSGNSSSGSDVPVYMLVHDALYDLPHPYAAQGLQAFSGSTLLCRSAFALGRALDWIPDVIHLHDWPTALAATMLETIEAAPPFDRTASVLTIHNLAHQPWFDPAGIAIAQLPQGLFHPGVLENFGAVNPMKGGMAYATLLTTVSPTYAEEIRHPPASSGLEILINARTDKLVGITNGIDTDVWNPATDPLIWSPYSADDIEGKASCKSAIQRHFGLPVDPDVPLIGSVSRWVSQKGIDVIADSVDRIAGLGAQLIMLGTGDAHLQDRLQARNDLQDDHFRAYVGYDEALAHQIEAGADLFLMPSRFEPCGLNQLYSQRYGTLPIVRATGGLADTVDNYDEASGEGTGFVLHDLNADALVATIAWALHVYRDQPEAFAAMRERVLRLPLGWSPAAAKYHEVYRRALVTKRMYSRAAS